MIFLNEVYQPTFPMVRCYRFPFHVSPENKYPRGSSSVLASFGSAIVCTLTWQMEGVQWETLVVVQGSLDRIGSRMCRGTLDSVVPEPKSNLRPNSAQSDFASLATFIPQNSSQKRKQRLLGRLLMPRTVTPQTERQEAPVVPSQGMKGREKQPCH